MGALRNIVAGAITLALAFSYQAYRDLSKPLPKPELGKKKKETFSLRFHKTKRNFPIYPNKFFFSFLADLKEYWGRGDGKSYKEDKTIKPFKISYSAEVGTLALLFRLAWLPMLANVYEYLLIFLFLHIAHFSPSPLEGNKAFNG